MLGSIEQVVVAALRAVLPKRQTINAGPSLTPPTSPRLDVFARSLGMVGQGDDVTNAGSRQPAYLSRRFVLSADIDPTNTKNRRNFSLPDNAFADVEDVQSPRGRIVKRGDDYAVDGRVIRFYQNEPPEPVEIVTRGDPAVGYQQRTRSQVHLDLVAWASSVEEADKLLTLAVPAVLKVFVGLNTITLGWDNEGFRLRLLGVVTNLIGIERNSETSTGSNWVRDIARFVLRGELELMVAMGTEETTGTVQEIIYKTLGDTRLRE